MTATATGSMRNALHPIITPTIAELTAAGGTLTQIPTTGLKSGSPATSSIRLRDARLTGLTGTELIPSTMTGATANRFGRNAPASSIDSTIASQAAAGFTTSPTTSMAPCGSTATSLISGRNARLTRRRMTACATGSGRTAPASSFDPTSAPMTAAGGTTSPTTTMAPSGSPATSLNSGKNAGTNGDAY